MFDTVPVTISCRRSLYSEKRFVRSASRIFIVITWRVACAAIRPSRVAGTSISIVSPGFASGFCRLARASDTNPAPVSVSDTTSVSNILMFRLARSISTRQSFVNPALWRAACCMACWMAVSTTSRPTPRSFSI